MYGLLLRLVLGNALASGNLTGVSAVLRILAVVGYLFACFVVWGLLFATRTTAGESLTGLRETPAGNVLWLLACLPMVRVLIAPSAWAWLVLTVPGSMLWLAVVGAGVYVTGSLVWLLALFAVGMAGAALFDTLVYWASPTADIYRE